MSRQLALVALLAACAALLGQEGRTVDMVKRGNIRFGPSTEAPVIVTLNAGSKVELLRPAEGREGWYVIRFPREGHAWMHERTLTPTSDPRRFRVGVDGARVRSDSRASAEMVDELAMGETVEWVGREANGQWFGRKVGSWYAVYPANAIAYVYQSVLGLDGSVVEEVHTQAIAKSASEQLWQDASARYVSYRANMERDPETGLDQEWVVLAHDLAQVVQDHPSIKTRLMAKKLYAGIQRMLAMAQRVRVQQGHTPLPALPDIPDPGVHASSPPQVQPDPITQVEPQPPISRPPQPEPQPQPQPQPEQPSEPDVPVSEQVGAVLPTVEPAVDNSRMGWLVQRDVELEHVNHALIDENNSVKVLIKTPPGSTVQLSEFFWRRVTVEGATENVTLDLDGQSMTVPVVTVSAVKLVR